jgi:hypothetical protein
MARFLNLDTASFIYLTLAVFIAWIGWLVFLALQFFKLDFNGNERL